MRDVLGVFVGLGRMLAREKSWWMIPILIALAIVGVFILVVALAPAAPFLYPLF